MWARMMEISLGCWLLMSPFIFRHGSEETALWATDFIAGSLLIVFSLLAFWEPTRRAHLLNIVVACWLIGFGRLYIFNEPPAALQNYILVGLLDLMFAIIPNDASRPPASWENYSLNRDGETTESSNPMNVPPSARKQEKATAAKG